VIRVRVRPIEADPVKGLYPQFERVEGGEIREVLHPHQCPEYRFHCDLLMTLPLSKLAIYLETAHSDRQERAFLTADFFIFPTWLVSAYVNANAGLGEAEHQANARKVLDRIYVLQRQLTRAAVTPSLPRGGRPRIAKPMMGFSSDLLDAPRTG
jgi:hypothetical protein